MLALAAGAALIGCSSLTSTPWRVEPTLRVEGGMADAAPGYLALAQQYEGEDRTAQALDAYRKAAQAAPTDADVQNALGLALARHGQFGDAVAALRRAVALEPERAQLLNNLGYALLLDGRAGEARAMFRLTLAVDPAHELASRNLAYIDQKFATAPAPKAALQVAVVPAAEVPVAQGVAPAAREAASPGPPPAIAAAPVAPPQLAPGGAAAAEVRPAVSGPGSLAGVSIEIVNGNGIGGAAARMRQLLRERGIEVGRLANLLPFDSLHTRVLYRPGKADVAKEMAQRMPVAAGVGPAPAGSTRADLSVLLGHDVSRGAGCESLGICAARPVRVAATGDLKAQDPARDRLHR